MKEKGTGNFRVRQRRRRPERRRGAEELGRWRGAVGGGGKHRAVVARETGGEQQVSRADTGGGEGAGDARMEAALGPDREEDGADLARDGGAGVDPAQDGGGARAMKKAAQIWRERRATGQRRLQNMADCIAKYRQMRRREQDRLARMDADYQKRKEVAEFNLRREERVKAAEERTAKKRLKRQKKKRRKKEKRTKTSDGGEEPNRVESSDDDEGSDGDDDKSK